MAGMKSHLELVAVAALAASLLVPTVASATQTPQDNANQVSPVTTLMAEMRNAVTNESDEKRARGVSVHLPPETAAQLARLNFGTPYSRFENMKLVVPPAAPVQRDLWIAGP